jgi:aldose 1-epimerase
MTTPRIEQDRFGTTRDGTAVERYTLTGRAGLKVRLIAFGATVTELWAPDRRGEPADVVLGFDSLERYETRSPYFGSTVGRVAFRIAHSVFTLEGRVYHLTPNNGPHHLHGGPGGFSWRVWSAEPIESADGPAVRFTLESPDGDQGYPGNLDATALYSVTDRNELRIELTAKCDRPTPVNMTHHGYFNLAGARSGDVLGHAVRIDADRYSTVDEATIPTGKLARVEGTAFDFREPTAVGARIKQLGGEPGGYDLAYLLTQHDAPLRPAAGVYEPKSGRVLEVLTTEPALIFYTGNYLDGTLRGKGGATYPKHAGLCLEPGGLPDAVNHPGFPSIILRPGETYRHTIVYQFSAR